MKNLKLAKTTLLLTSLTSSVALASELSKQFELSADDAREPTKVAKKVTFIGYNAFIAFNSATRALTEIDKVSSKADDVFNKANEAATLASNTKAELKEITEKLESFDEKVLEGKASQADLDQTNLELGKKADQAALDAANAKITKNQQALNETKAELANKVSTQELAKKADQSALDAANAKITKNQQALNETKAELANKVSTQELGKKADQSALDAANVQITKTQQNLSETKAELANKVSTQELAKKADKSALDAANLMIQRNQQAIALLAPANITKLHEQVQSNTARLNKLDKELQRGVATQAALSGLFQPYNVGKVNLTAAVGGYKSKSAVAVGMGYRVNEKFATKAGIAVSIGNSSSAAYNVGVNYEF